MDRPKTQHGGAGRGQGRKGKRPGVKRLHINVTLDPDNASFIRQHMTGERDFSEALNRILAQLREPTIA